MRLSTKISGIVAIGGVAALGAGLISSGGIGAAFTDSATAKASIDVGDFGCSLSTTATSDVNIPDAHTAEFSLGTIQSSAADSRTAPLTVTNSGTMPVKVTWTATKINSNLGSKFTPIPVASAILPNHGDAQSADIGFDWTTLDNNDLTHTGTAKYTISCDETGFSLFSQDGGTAGWDTSTQSLVLTIPNANPNQYGYGPAGAGITVNGVSPSLPSTNPGMVTDAFSTGTPRWNIELTNGKYVSWYPDGTSQTRLAPAGWVWHNTSYGWSGVQSFVGSDTVTSAYIVADTSASPANDALDVKVNNVTCASYNGTVLFGSGC